MARTLGKVIRLGVEEWNAPNPNDQVTLSEPQYAGTTSEGGC